MKRLTRRLRQWIATRRCYWCHMYPISTGATCLMCKVWE